jgi:ABC-type dipeptide/oligopeptide/nickel transport system permease component
MITPPHHARPYALPLRLALGGAGMAVLFLLLHGGSITGAAKLLLGLTPPSDTPSLTLLACARTLALLTTALLLAFATSLCLLVLTRCWLPSSISLLAHLGRLLFATPALGLVSAWAGWWVGSSAGVIETLMPPRPHELGEDFTESLARHLWTALAPTFAIAIPLTGCLLSQITQSLNPAPNSPFILGLRARGLSHSQILDRHLLPLLWPRWHRALEASLFAALPLALLIEYALDFPGWGNGLVHALQTQNPQATALGLYASGLMLALLTGLLQLIRPRSLPAPLTLETGMERDEDGVVLGSTRLSGSQRLHRKGDATREAGSLVGPMTAADSPSAISVFRLTPSPVKKPILPVIATLLTLLLAIPFLLTDSSSPLHHQATQLITGQTWLTGWKNDALACLWILELALIGGPILAALRLTILGDWLRRYGSLETLVWSPLPIWAIAWSHTSGHIISIDLAIASLAAITLSIHLHTSTRRHTSSPLLQASRALGATSIQAWRTHALFPWLLELFAFLLSLFAAAWWLRIASFSLSTPEKSDPLSSIGTFIAHAATDAFHHPLPLLSASLAAAVSILFWWTLGRIIHPLHPDDA